MKKLTQTQIKNFLNFLEENKYMVGLHGWTVIMSSECIGSDSFATCIPDIYEQTITIAVNNDFMELEDERQESILIHELVHGRIEIYKKIVDELTVYEEERLANDLERGFFSLYKKNK